MIAPGQRICSIDGVQYFDKFIENPHFTVSKTNNFLIGFLYINYHGKQNR